MPFLTGKTIVITRPAHQAQHLSRLIENQGGKTLLFPTMEILPALDQQNLLTAIKQISLAQIAIFVSANAAHYALALQTRPFPVMPVIAIGPGTARALQANQVNVSGIPQTHDSEGILTLPELQNIQGKKCAIFCGENSRPTLKNALKARGAIVNEIICYRRRCPDVNVEQVLKQWQTENEIIIVSTSSENLANLWQLFAKIATPWLMRTKLLVISPAMAAQAKQMGFQSIIVAAGASDEAICTALRRDST